MKFKKILVLSLVAFVTVATFSPVSVQASSLLDVISTDTDVRNTDTDINDSSLIDKSMSRIKTGNTEDGSNSSATANSNSGDGVNTNVSSTDVINTEVKDNLNNNSLFNGSKSNSTDKSTHTDNSTHTDKSKDNSTTIVINNNSDNRTYKNYASSDTSSSSTTTSSSSTSSSNRSRQASSSNSTKSSEDGVTIEDEDVALGSYLGDAWEIAHEKKATCTKDGYIVYHNKETGEQFAETIDALGHSIVATTEPGSFFKSAKTITYCEDCGEIISEEKEKNTTLPFAGVFSAIGAVFAAVIKRH